MTSRYLPPLAIVASALLLPIAADAAPRGDADGDGKLSLSEFQTVAQKRMMRADKDVDGKVSLQEWLARPAAAKAKHDPTEQFNRLDANKDGQLDAAEIAVLVKRRFAALDKNADGALTDEERPSRKPAQSNPDNQDGAAMDDDADAPEAGKQSAE
jgi:Ca2+-binding EF-hand superfamily protein